MPFDLLTLRCLQFSPPPRQQEHDEGVKCRAGSVSRLVLTRSHLHSLYRCYEYRHFWKYLPHGILTLHPYKFVFVSHILMVICSLERSHYHKIMKPSIQSRTGAQYADRFMLQKNTFTLLLYEIHACTAHLPNQHTTEA